MFDSSPLWEPGSFGALVADRDATERRRRALEKAFRDNDGVLTVDATVVAETVRTFLDVPLWDCLTADLRREMVADRLDEMALELTVKVLAENLPTITVIERSTMVGLEARAAVQCEVPATWWDHLKDTHADTWWLRWLVRRRPVATRTLRAERVERDTRRVTLSVDVGGMVLYPESALPVRPEEYGRPVRRVHVDSGIAVQALIDQR